MKVTQVSLLPTAAARAAGRPALTPELLAATGARYSRSNDGLAAILAKVDPADPDRAVDSIFRMVDYGHQSIADMVPVALFMDGISLWLAYHVWSLCPTAGGQESSTRYLSLDAAGLVPADQLGITGETATTWREGDDTRLRRLPRQPRVLGNGGRAPAGVDAHPARPPGGPFRPRPPAGRADGAQLRLRPRPLLPARGREHERDAPHVGTRLG